MPGGEPRCFVELTDLHAGGDVSRIITGGVRPPPGASLAQQARYLEQHADGLRRLLLSEPYGSPAMSVDLVVPPIHRDAEAGYLIMEAMGYPAFSGSNTICTATALLEAGHIAMEEGDQALVLEAPSGPVSLTAKNRDGRVMSISYEGAPAFVAERGIDLQLDSGRRITVDVVFGGVYFAVVQADALGMRLGPDEHDALMRTGRQIIDALQGRIDTVHPVLGPTGPLSFVHFAGAVDVDGARRLRSRSVTYTHPDVICRSPTGTGTAARLAMLIDDGKLAPGDSLETVSLNDSVFRGAVLGPVRVGRHAAQRPLITARAWPLAHSRLVIDPDDPLMDDGTRALLMQDSRAAS